MLVVTGWLGTNLDLYCFHTSSINIHQQNYTLMSHWFLTPKKLHHIKSGHSPLYWRYSEAQGAYIHCWWKCLPIQSFWKQVLDQIKSLTGYSIPPTPESVLCYYWGNKHILDSSKSLIITMLTVAKTQIAQCWKAACSLSIEQWYSKVWEHYKV